eukprot:g14520.t1
MAAFERRRLPLAAVRLIAATSILSTLAAARDSSCVVDCVNGFCDEKLGVCQCRPNFGGESCNVLIGNEDTEFPHKFQGNGMTELPNYTRKYDEVSILSRAAHLKSSISKLFSKEDPDSSEARIAHIQALVQDDVREEDKEMALASKKRKKDAEVVESLSLHRQGEEKGENEDADRKKSQSTTARLPSTAAGAEKGATNKIRKLPEEILPAAMSSPVTTSKAGGLLVRGDEQRGSDQDQLQPTNTIVQQLLSAPLDEKVEVYGPRATALAATNAMKSLASSVGGPRQKLVVKKAPPARPRAAGVALLQMSGASTAGAGELQQLQQQQSAAPKPCSGHGNVTTIADGSAVCKCEPTHTGALCDTPRCTDDCNHQGLCVGGMCVCAPTSFGSFCQFKRCPHDCMGYGYCNLQGKCECNSGHSGEDCATVLAAGLVVTLSLDEAKPRASPAPNSLISTLRHVSEAKACADKDRCNMRGVCGNGGRCECYPGYSGDSCQQSCPNECSHNGHCMSGQCMDKFPLHNQGKFCEAPQCPGGWQPEIGGFSKSHGKFGKAAWHPCQGRGLCDGEGKCVCAAGYSGDDCGVRDCAFDCGAHGSCAAETATCSCETGWTGPNCRDPDCKNGCSGKGECVFAMNDSPGECRCAAGFAGDDCSVVSFETTLATCPNNCSGNGLCMAGTCSCSPGFFGAACEKEECEDLAMMGPNCDLPRCPNDCSAKGACMNGRCSCYAEFLGQDCSIPTTCYEPCKSKCEVDSGSETCRFCVGQCSSLANHPTLGHHSPFEDLQNSLLQSPSSSASAGGLKTTTLIQPASAHAEVYSKDVVYGM